MLAKDQNALFLDTLKDIYYAEKQIYKALPKWPRRPTPPNFARRLKSIMTKPRARSSASTRF